MLTFDRTLLARYQGALLGLAAGDALGTTLEFKRRGSFSPIDDTRAALMHFVETNDPSKHAPVLLQ